MFGTSLTPGDFVFPGILYLLGFWTLFGHAKGDGPAILFVIGTVFLAFPVGGELWRRRARRKLAAQLAGALGAATVRVVGTDVEVAMEGAIARVDVRGIGSTRDSHAIAVAAGASKHLVLEISPETERTRREAAMGRGVDVEIGDAALDAALAIEGAPLAAVQPTLLDPRVKPFLGGLVAARDLHVTVRDGSVRVYTASPGDAESVVRLALGLVLASTEHAVALDQAVKDPLWQSIHDAAEARAERQELIKAWMSQVVAVIVGLSLWGKASGLNMKVSLGPLEIVIAILSLLGLPRYTAGVLAAAGVAWVGFAIPAVRRHRALRNGRLFVGGKPEHSFILVPAILVCLAGTYSAESSAPAATHPAQAAPSARPKH